ncbi:MAG: hypothetical protein Q7R97_05620 [Candidatus Daviesbacteria bacterium]|nr:hypothetical protein [Candidatus Daviesbacteria bacterium]
MKTFDLDSSPLLESFKDLQYGETIYSKKYGLGQVRGFFEEEIIVQFSNTRKRFAVDDKEIRYIPDDYFIGRSKKVKVFYEGEEMSYAEYKKMAGLTRKGKKEEKLKHVTLKEATDILGISKAELFKTIAMNNIQTKTFGRNTMIHRDDLLKLDRVIKA